MRKILALTAAGVLAAQAASAATVSVSGVAPRNVTAAEAGNGAPAGAKVFDFKVTSSSDILSINEVVITLENGATIYQNSAGSNTEPPLPALIAALPALGADSWITTPGDTASAGGAFGSDPNDKSTYFDTSDSGAQTDFVFARITLTSGKATFAGNVTVLGDTGAPEDFAFSFVIPEPTTVGLAAFGLIGLGLRRRQG